MHVDSFYVFSFYRFCKLKNKKKIKKILEHYFRDKIIKGTVLLADEGINASLSSSEEDLVLVIKYIKKILGIRKLEVKINKSHFLPFNRIKVRLKNEIVSLGTKGLQVKSHKALKVAPKDWNNLIQNKDYKTIDVRNDYEIDIGKFNNSLNPNTKSFREFPKKLEALNIKKNDKLALYCTGGIRCEKAAAYLQGKGFKNIYQLDGGILNYLNFHKNKKNSKWLGECFVFDNRVTVDKYLQKGSYDQCHGCRHPITTGDKKLKSFKKGISCKYCFKKRTKTQLQKSEMRQKQIELYKKMGVDHPFKKVSV